MATLRLHILHRDTIPATETEIPASALFGQDQLYQGQGLPGEPTLPVIGSVTPVVLVSESGLELLNPATAGLALPSLHPQTPIRAVAIEGNEWASSAWEALVRFRFAELDAARILGTTESLEAIVTRLDTDALVASTIAHRWLNRHRAVLGHADIARLVGPHIHEDTPRRARERLITRGVLAPAPPPPTKSKSNQASTSQSTSAPPSSAPGNLYPQADAAGDLDEFPVAVQAFSRVKQGTTLQGWALVEVLMQVEGVWVTTPKTGEQISAASALVISLAQKEDPAAVVNKFCAKMEQYHGIRF